MCASSYNHVVEVGEYYGCTLKHLQIKSLGKFLQSISNKKDCRIAIFHNEKLQKYMYKSLIYSSVEVIMSSRLAKFIKPEIVRPNIFFLNNEFIAKYTKDKIKEYFDMSCFTKEKQQEIVDVLNYHYDNLTIIKNPSKNELIFEIKGKEFIKRVWNKYENKYYPIVNEDIKL